MSDHISYLPQDLEKRVREYLSTKVITQSLAAAMPDSVIPTGSQKHRNQNQLIITIPQFVATIEMYIEQRITVGRSQVGDTFVPGLDLAKYMGAQLGVSRYHAELIMDSGRLHIQDMNSTNGTWVNDRRIMPDKPVPISEFDVIRVGHLVLKIA